MRAIVISLLLACAAGAGAQEQAQPAQAADKAKAAAPAPKKKARTAVKAAAPAAAPAAKAKPDAKADQEGEESVVMIDSKADIDETGRFSAAGGDQDEQQPAVPGGLPASYGQLKGVLNEGGRSLLVFESPDDGAITFVQVTVGRTGVAWKLVDRIPRSGD